MHTFWKIEKLNKNNSVFLKRLVYVLLFFQLAIEAITNIRTVAGLGREKMFVKRYIQELDHPHVQAKRKSHLRGKFNFTKTTKFDFEYTCSITN